MRINISDLRRHYEELSDEELLDLNRAQLMALAQQVYDEEMERRGLNRKPEVTFPGEPEEQPDAYGVVHWNPEDGTPPDWLEDAACVHSIVMHPGANYADSAAEVQAALHAAGIPSFVTEEPQEDGPGLYCVMVHGELNMHATGIIERDVYNPQYEADWRTHLRGLSDEQLAVLKPDIFCAGLLDKAARMKRAYLEELALRKQTG